MPESSPAIRFAATVLVMRDAPEGPELLMLKRAARMAFYGGAWVFPGGGIEPDDGDLERALPDAARRAAVRELREEAGLDVRPEELLGFSRWLTPPGLPRRFDTFYFAVAAPDAPVRLDPMEADDFRWLTPSAALEARERAEIELPPPTFVTLSVLGAADSVGDAFRILGDETIHFVPLPLPVAEGTVYLYTEDAGYATADLDARGARHRLWALREGWRYERSS